MKVWPIDPLDPRHLRLEVPEKLTNKRLHGQFYYEKIFQSRMDCVNLVIAFKSKLKVSC